ncbi:unnamed protein product [Phytomonas sp. EM1]|nr:unnamed protein product [Phytomonas sp. EM1]|eukprot:CCW61229.1 unnamed protein product [Phytomonas sp. isolate EM1]
MHSNSYQQPLAQQNRPTVDLDELFGSNNGRITSAPTQSPLLPNPLPQQQYLPGQLPVSAPELYAVNSALPPPPPYDYGEDQFQRPPVGNPVISYKQGVTPYAAPQLQRVVADGLATVPPWTSNNQASAAPPNAGAYPSVYYQPSLQAAVPSSAPSHPVSPVPNLLKEDEDREQLGKIIRLRRELELEQEREQQKLRELNTWGCVECTYRNDLDRNECEMCGIGRPGFAKRNPVPPASTDKNRPTSMHAPQPPQVPGSSGNWQCHVCLAPNEASRESCKVCSAFHKNGILARATYDNVSSRVNQQNSAAKPVSTMNTRWRCSICSTINEPSRSNCTACNGYQRNGIPLVGESDAAMSSPAGVSGGGRGGSASPASGFVDSTPSLPTIWPCSVCSLENPVSVAVCQACESGQRPRHLAPANGAAFARPSTSTGASTGPQGRREIREAESDRGRPVEWPCPACTFVNRIELFKCDMCGGARPQQYTPPVTEGSKREKKRQEDDDRDEVQWQENGVAKACNRCQNEFGLMRRRHHCRVCGYVFCATCSPFHVTVKKGSDPVRACVDCYEARKKKG